jgi:hypothetical protein
MNAYQPAFIYNAPFRVFGLCFLNWHWDWPDLMSQKISIEHLALNNA